MIGPTAEAPTRIPKATRTDSGVPVRRPRAGTGCPGSSCRHRFRPRSDRPASRHPAFEHHIEPVDASREALRRGGRFGHAGSRYRWCELDARSRSGTVSPGCLVQRPRLRCPTASRGFRFGGTGVLDTATSRRRRGPEMPVRGRPEVDNLQQLCLRQFVPESAGRLPYGHVGWTTASSTSTYHSTASAARGQLSMGWRLV